MVSRPNSYCYSFDSNNLLDHSDPLHKNKKVAIWLGNQDPHFVHQKGPGPTVHYGIIYHVHYPCLHRKFIKLNKHYNANNIHQRYNIKLYCINKMSN